MDTDPSPVQITAVACEIGEHTVKLFDWKLQNVEVPKSHFGGGVQLGKFYYLYDGLYEQGYCDSVIKVFIDNGVVHMKVLAFAPNDSQLVQGRVLQKYRHTAYSHLLQLLEDPNDLFSDYPNMEVAVATVKYAPTERSAFEVVAVADLDKELCENYPFIEHLTSTAPWIIEIKEQTKHLTSKPDPSCIRFSQLKSICAAHVFKGVCVLKMDPRPEANQWARENSITVAKMRKNKEQVHSGRGKYRTQFDASQVFYSWSLGLCRSFGMEYEVEIGKWYKFTMSDHDRSRKKRKGETLEEGDTHYKRAKVKEMIEIPSPIPSEMVNGVIQMTTDFIFDHDELEFMEHRSANADWRRQHLSNSSHFYCPSLGKVEIYPHHAWEIISIIEKHRDELEAEDPAQYQRLKNEKIGVVVKVELLNDLIGRFQQQPDTACFLVKEVSQIFYLIGGKIIYKDTRRS